MPVRGKPHVGRSLGGEVTNAPPCFSTPSSAGSWPTAIEMPTPTLKPVRSGTEMGSATKPRWATAPMTRKAPAKSARTCAAPCGSGEPRIVAAVTAAMEEVVLTLRGHEEPFSA